MDKPKIVPPRLLRQMRLAAAVLIGPWLVTICLYWAQFRLHPAMILGLLPGLAAALRIQGQLSHHLGTNHRRGEEVHIFTTLGAANWITLLRAGAVVGLAGILPLAIQRGPALPDALLWAPGIIYLGISLADLVDGYVARQQRRETVLGKRLDIESDAAGLLVASLVAVALGRLPAVYLLVGLAYYPFILGIWIRQRRALPVIALQPRPYARIIAGFQMGLVAMALLPIFNPPFLSVAALIFMTPLLIGFWRDWRVVSGRVKADADQLTTLGRRASALMLKTTPLVLRLVILAAGVTTLVRYGVFQTHPLWQLAHSLCCLLAGLGCMGRNAGLFLTLILGSTSSPFGMSAISMVTFGTRATLMLTGTGAMSLWAPEESILYRRGKNRSMTACEAA
jgi:CDP-diacylglycerol--glycerol-3-phosphate 3-phosphatidyltransferase